jgi:hypothetical protein
MTLSVGNRLCTGPRLTGQCKINHFAIISLHLPHDSDARRRPRRRVAAGLERRRRLAAGGPPPDSAPAIADATLAGQLPPPPSPLYGARCRGDRGSGRLRWSTPPLGGPGPDCRAGTPALESGPSRPRVRSRPLWSLDWADPAEPARAAPPRLANIYTCSNRVSAQRSRPGRVSRRLGCDRRWRSDPSHDRRRGRTGLARRFGSSLAAQPTGMPCPTQRERRGLRRA